MRLLNRATTAARSGYVCVSLRGRVYSAGGPTGEVFSLDSSGAFNEGPALQELDCVQGRTGPVGGKLDKESVDDKGNVMDFGGLRHGAHSADLSPDGKTLYVADM